MKVDIEVKVADLKIGDRIITCVYKDGSVSTPWPGHYEVESDGDEACKGLKWWQSAYPVSKGFRGLMVRRDANLITRHPVVNGTFSIADTPPAGRVIDPWPLTCPKCGRSKSAYLGLNQYDCKHGCYGR